MTDGEHNDNDDKTDDCDNNDEVYEWWSVWLQLCTFLSEQQK